MKYKKILNNENFQIGVISILIIILVLAIAPVNLGLFKSDKSEVIQVNIKTITSEDCVDCFNLDSVINQLKSDESINVKSVQNIEYSSPSGKKLIEKYDIKRIPSFILESKSLDRSNFDNDFFRFVGDDLVFDKPVPYIDLNSNSEEVIGLVEFKEIQDGSCKDCSTYSQLLKLLIESGVKQKSYEIYDVSSPAGKDLLEKNSLEVASSLLVSKDIEEYWWLFDSLKEGLEEKGDYYLIKQKVYPYKEIVSGKILGVTNVIYLINESCEECYDPEGLKRILQTLGVFIKVEKRVDISTEEGKALIKNQDINAIPTMIISKEISDYEGIDDILLKAGITEKNGKYVFRNVKELNVKYQQI